jgi:hypothetical protein
MPLTEEEELELLELEEQEYLSKQSIQPVKPIEKKPLYDELVKRDAEELAVNAQESVKKDPSLYNRMAAPVRQFTGTMASQVNQTLPYRFSNKTIGAMIEGLKSQDVSDISRKIPGIESDPYQLPESVRDEPLSKSFIDATDKYKALPEKAKNTFGTIGDLLGMLPGIGAAEKGIMKAPSAVKSIDKGLSKVAESLNKSPVDEGVMKGIKPRFTSEKKTVAGLDDYKVKADEAMKTIVEYKDKINLVDDAGEKIALPKNNAHLAQSIEKTKDQIFKEYSQLARQAGDAGATFNTSSINSKLDAVINSTTPNEFKVNAKRIKKDIQQLEGAPPETVQEWIKHYNEDLQSYYAGRGIPRSEAQVKASVASAMREELDNKIAQAAGEGYQGLKNKYGALKAIELDVNHRALQLAKKANKGIFDLTDIFTGGEIVSGIVSGNPALIAKGMTGKAAAEYYKWLNNPDRYINKWVKYADTEYSGIPKNEPVSNLKQPITDPKRILPYQKVGTVDQPIENMEIPVGAKIRKLGESGAREFDKPIAKYPALPSPEDVKKRYPKLTKENERPMAAKLTPIGEKIAADGDLPKTKAEYDAAIAEKAKKYRVSPEQYQKIEDDILKSVRKESPIEPIKNKPVDAEWEVYKENVEKGLDKPPVISVDEMKRKERIKKMNAGKQIKKSGNQPGDIASWHKISKEDIDEKIKYKRGTIGDLIKNMKRK